MRCGIDAVTKRPFNLAKVCHIAWRPTEFWIHCTRAGRLADLAAIEQRMLDLIVAALQRDGRPGSSATARDLYVVLLGSIVDQTGKPADTARVQSRVQALLAAAG